MELASDSHFCDNVVPTDKDNNVDSGLEQLFFKNDRIYKHRLIHINYTTYDVRREEHVINPRTSHSCVMVLADHTGDINGQEHQILEDPFWYGQVLGIYHANMIYTGPGMRDYRPRTFQFLWVRWFRNINPIEWGSQRFQQVAFPPTASEDAFGFLNPADVLRSCHILPRFASGRVHLDGIGISKLAGDNQDWRIYYVNRSVTSLAFHFKLFNKNRFVDRDMLMRCYWGMGVGHVYAHGTRDNQATNSTDPNTASDSESEHDVEMVDVNGQQESAVEQDDGDNEDDPELGLEDREKDQWDSEDSDTNIGIEDEEEELDPDRDNLKEIYDAGSLED